MDEVRIVVVDDSADAAEMLASLLTVYGYTVRVAHDGDQALAVVEEFYPHCVVLDIKMPGLDGNGLSRQLRERFGDDIVLVAVTGAAVDDRSVEETFVRVDHYLMKPVTDAVLRRVLPPLQV
jgi:CheY-like chemotaxis protein